MAVGLRYGHGELVYKRGGGRKVDWQGPSLGFDIGANTVKVFVLVYDLPSTDALFQRSPASKAVCFLSASSASTTCNAMVFHSRRCASVSAGGKVSA